MSLFSTYHFKVTGSGFFPLDMLRYDRCWPATQEDVHRINERDTRTIELGAQAAPHAERWKSFGWTVKSC